mmetsp:Transcript_35374/g.73652  ORF Transcript_35374/g.73652 Transcript_35374/m.73652 type:complete len:155 (-) Transcript_35374:120-584(-)
MAKAPTAGFLSKMTVFKSARDVYKAHVQPAGPPPIMATSHSMTSMNKREEDDPDGNVVDDDGRLWVATLAAARCVDGVTKAWQVSVCVINRVQPRARAESVTPLMMENLVIIPVDFSGSFVKSNHCLEDQSIQSCRDVELANNKRNEGSNKRIF